MQPHSEVISRRLLPMQGFSSVGLRDPESKCRLINTIPAIHRDKFTVCATTAVIQIRLADLIKATNLKLQSSSSPPSKISHLRPNTAHIRSYQGVHLKDGPSRRLARSSTSSRLKAQYCLDESYHAKRVPANVLI